MPTEPTNNVEVTEVESPSALRQFIDYPTQLYRHDPYYVTPLRSERLEFFDFKRNPFYRTAKVKLFLARRGTEVVGRIATCINYTHNDCHHEAVGFFGFFDCDNDYEVAQKLLKVAMIEVKREGMEKMRGPMNFSTNHECGFLVDGFEQPPTVMMNYNRPYLPKLAEKFGLKKAMDMVTYIIHKDRNPMSERMQAVVQKLRERSKITLRTLNMADFDNEVARVRTLYNEAWEQNWGFVPMSDDEFTHAAGQMRQIVDPDLVFIAEYEGQPVGFSLALPDINQALIHLNGRLFPFGLIKLLWHTKIRNKVEGMRMVMFGVSSQFRNRGVDSMMYIATYQTGLVKGYKWAELSWILETNDLMCRAAEAMGGEPWKRYRIVEMPI